MSDNVSVNSAKAFSALVEEGAASKANLLELGKAIGYSSEELSELFPVLFEDEDEDADDDLDVD